MELLCFELLCMPIGTYQVGRCVFQSLCAILCGGEKSRMKQLETQLQLIQQQAAELEKFNAMWKNRLKDKQHVSGFGCLGCEYRLLPLRRCIKCLVLTPPAPHV